jgi:peptide/nickel transport system substrate-binding protein/oligopeptide transport system substrate-binding protein
MLRRGVTFHHGRELTADDVAFSLTRLVDPRTRSGAADLFSGIKGAADFRAGKAPAVEGITVVDRYTVRVTLTEAFAPFVSLLAIGHAKIVPRDAVERQGDGFGRHPVGTGPFRFVRWEPGREILLEANPAYFERAPRLRGIRYRVFEGEPIDAIHREFERGHLEDSPVPLALRGGGGAGKHQYVRRTMFSVRFYGFNTRVRPLDDRRVRQAIAHAIDRARIRDDIFLGRYQPAHGILPPGTPGYNPNVREIPYDPGRARELLRAAGFGAHRPVPPVAFWSSVKTERLSREHEAVRAALAAVGVPAEVRYETRWPVFSRLLAEGKLPMFLYAWNADVPDPDNFLYTLFHSKSPRNLTGYANPAVDQLLAGARSERELSRRVELYRRAEQIVLDDAPVIPVWHYTYERLFQPYVRSIEVNGLGDPYIPFSKIWLEPPG